MSGVSRRHLKVACKRIVYSCEASQGDIERWPLSRRRVFMWDVSRGHLKVASIKASGFHVRCLKATSKGGLYQGVVFSCEARNSSSSLILCSPCLPVRLLFLRCYFKLPVVLPFFFFSFLFSFFYVLFSEEWRKSQFQTNKEASCTFRR